MAYEAIINTPGYLPQADEPAIFETAQEAWSYLADERTREEDQTEGGQYSDTREKLAALGEVALWQASGHNVEGKDYVAAWLADNGLAQDGTGTVYGGTAGYTGSHDLGTAYEVVHTDAEVPQD